MVYTLKCGHISHSIVSAAITGTDGSGARAIFKARVLRMAGAGELIGYFIKKNSSILIIIALLFISVSAVYAGQIYMATGTETFIGKDTQAYKDIEYYNDNFQATTFLIMISSDDVLDPDVLGSMAAIDERVSSDPKIKKVTGLQDIVAEGNKAEYGYYGIPRNKHNVEYILEKAEKSLISFVMPDRHHTIMTVELDSSVEEKDEAALLDKAKAYIKWSQLPPGTSAIVTGKTAMMLEIRNEMTRSMAIMLIIAIFFMMVALWLTFRHAKWRLLPLPVVLSSLLFTGGVMGFLGIPITMVSMAVFPILIGLGVEYAIQIQNRMMEELSSGKPPEEAIFHTVKNIGPAVFYSMGTTCLGFLAILSSPVPMIHDFGMMCLIGIIVCFFAALFILTSLIRILVSGTPKIRITAEKAAYSGPLERTIGKIAEFTTGHPVIVAVALLLMVAGYVIDDRVGIEIDSSNFAPQDLPSVINFRSFMYIFGQANDDLTIQVKASDISSQDTIGWINWFENYEKSNNPEVLSVSSIATTLAGANNGSMPDTNIAIKNAMGRIPYELKKRYVDDYGTTGIIKMSLADMETDKKISFLKRVENDLSFYAPSAGTNVSLGGESQMTLLLFGSMSSDRLMMTMIGGISVFIGLLLVYRGDWIKAIVPVVAVVIVTGLSCVVMFILNMKYTPLSVTLGALTIGIGIDFSILHMERYFEEKAKGYPPEEAMRIATSKIGNAIFSSASTVIAGFGALVMSNFSILSNFGIVTIIDFMLALMSAFMIMPPLLVFLDKRRPGAFKYGFRKGVRS